ncbi:coiled-coil domain-containing protein 43 isoform X2 [Hylaeus anthracinus]|uniref:coiled-coil domain-containing protein 43 isoform X2 n=1 Tax=Hylaeus volcanicus TaxID=313075 RepID=UPI0023B785CF|nr:coiled-coil domain-containing protein 43 isoform X2 [Hylaeus volcanicus]XP_054004878.1 coiled-coil domain-containing protein 43 isoform X2 [Hylaeus anthracinus]
MALPTNCFDNWLNGDGTEDEKIEALEGIFAGITDDNISKHVLEILSAWTKCLLVRDETALKEPMEDVDVILSRVLDAQPLQTTTPRSYTAEERGIRDAILAQYSQTADEDQSEGEGEEEGMSGGDCGIEKNTNAALIVQQEREKREKAKLESQKKKEKDKEDREKQKQLKEEKKERRKTQKRDYK